MKYLIFLLSFLYQVSLSSQNSPRLFHSIKESGINTDSIQYFVVGEVHPLEEETVLVHKEILDLLVKRGEKKVIVDFELPPSRLYFVYKYFLTGDMNYIYEADLHYMMEQRIDLYRSYSGKIEFEFVPIDLSCSVLASENFDFYKYYFGRDTFLLIGHEAYKLKNKRRVVKFAQEYLTGRVDMSETRQDLDYKWLFDEDMKLIAEYGFVKHCRKNKGMSIRDIHMSGVLDSLYNENDTTPHIVSVGNAHITPNTFELPYTMTERITKIPRRKMLVIPVIYKSDLDLMNDKWYMKRRPSIEKWLEYINKGRVDVIINPKPEVLLPKE